MQILCEARTNRTVMNPDAQGRPRQPPVSGGVTMRQGLILIQISRVA